MSASEIRGRYDVLARATWLALGLTGGVAAVVVGSPWLLLAWIVPDLGVLVGGRHLVDAHGRLSRRAAIGYNVGHALAGPVAMAVLAAAVDVRLWAVVGLWTCHIGIDRALGYGLKPVAPRV